MVDLAKETEVVKKADGEQHPTQEPSMDVSTVQLVERVNGGVSPPQEPIGRTSESETLINVQQGPEAKLQKIDDLSTTNAILWDKLLSY